MYLNALQRQWAWLSTLKYPEVRCLSLRLLWKMCRLLGREKLVQAGAFTVVNSFLPPLNHPAFRRLMGNIPSIMRGKAVPVSAYIGVTGECGFNCAHCSNKLRPGKDMSADVILEAVTNLQELGVSIIGFTGGEPLRRKELESFVSACTQSATLLFTNGEGFTPERARGLKSAGLWGVAVSLDHYEEAEHDRGRGCAGAYKQAVQAVRAGKDQGLYTMTQVISHPDRCNPSFFDKYLDFARELGVHEIRWLEPMPSGHFSYAEEDCFLSAGQRRQLYDLHMYTNTLCEWPKVNAFAFIEDVSMFGCGAGFQHLYIDYTGNVCPCDFTPISFGNIHDEPLPEIWQRLNNHFHRPGNSCFLMDNMEVIRKHKPEKLPIPYREIASACRFNTDGDLPCYYRILKYPANQPS